MPAPEEINAGEKETRRQGNFFQRFGKRKIEKAKKEKSKEKRAHLLEKRGGKGPERLARRDRRPNGTRVFMMNLRQGGHPAPGDSNESKIGGGIRSSLEKTLHINEKTWRISPRNHNPFERSGPDSSGPSRDTVRRRFPHTSRKRRIPYG